MKKYVRMRLHKPGNEIRSVEDWFAYAPPKMRERQWKDGRGAKELALGFERTAQNAWLLMMKLKADEPSGDLIGEYFDRKTGSASKVPERIRQRSESLFGRVPDEAIRKLRYQLLHAAAATLIESASNGAELALLLVHEFQSAGLNGDKLRQNAADWENFVRAFPELAKARVARSSVQFRHRVEGGCQILCLGT